MPTNWKKIHAISIALAFSIFGSELSTFSVILRERDGGAGLVSTLFIVGTIPLIIWGPWAGWVADKFSTRQVVIAVNLLSAASVICLTQQLPLWLLLTVLFINASMGAFSGPSWSALIPTLTKNDEIARSQGLAQTYSSIARLAAPAVAGLLVSTTGYFWTFVIDSISFVAIALAPLYLGVNRPGQQQHEGQKIRVLEGFRIVAQNDLVRSLVILIFVFILSIGVINVALVFFITKTLHGSAFVYGLCDAALAVGSIIGAFAASKIKASLQRQSILMLAGTALLAVSMLLIALSSNWIPVVIFAVFAGIGNAALNSWGVGVVFAKTDANSRGRLAGALQTLFNLGGVGAIVIAGLTIDTFGIREVMISGILVSIAMLLAFGPSVYRASKRAFATSE